MGKIKWIFPCLLVVVFLLGLGFIVHKKNLYSRTSQKIRTVELGMTKEQVLEIMGPPDEVIEVRHLIIWYYPYPIGASEFTSCEFDKDTGRVIRVTDGENYHLYKSRNE